MSGKDLLLVTTYYWPDHTGIAPYATEMAEHLAARGDRVEVLTGLPHYPQWKLSTDDRRVLARTEHRHGVEIRRLRQYVPRRQSAARRGAYELTFLLHALARYRGARSVDVVVSLVPNLANGALAARIGRRAGAPHVMFLQDLSGTGAAQSGVSGGAAVARVVGRIETAIARRAEVVAITSPSFRPSLERAGVGADRVVDFPNWSRLPPATRPRGEVRRRLGWQPEERVVLHAGNMGMKQGLEWLGPYAAEAARVAPALRFVLVGDGSQREAMVAMAETAANLEVLAPVPEEDLPDLLGAADVLLVHERPSVRDMSLPSKLTAYFSAGRPVFGAVAPDGATAAEIRASGAGRVHPAADPAGVVEGLSALASDPVEGQRLGTAGRAYAERALSRSAALLVLEDLVDDPHRSNSRQR